MRRRFLTVAAHSLAMSLTQRHLSNTGGAVAEPPKTTTSATSQPSTLTRTLANPASHTRAISAGILDRADSSKTLDVAIVPGAAAVAAASAERQSQPRKRSAPEKRSSRREKDTSAMDEVPAARVAAASTANPTATLAAAATADTAHASGSAPLRAPRTVIDLPTAYKSFRNVMPLSLVRAKYSCITNGEKSTDVVRVGGRITSMRDMGRILFLSIRGDGQEMQLVRQASEAFPKSDLKKLKESLCVGDIVGAVGHPGRTVKGELSIYASELSILTPYVCADQSICPDLRGFTQLQDAEVKYRYRFVDMMTDPTAQQHFRKRHTATKALRAYLDDHGFVEVETPVLHQVASGANAKPFVTHHNALDADLYLRVAPELHLKQCVVGGMDRVYEIGRVFRNEDADRSHNPEFTSCEFYAAYHTYEDLIPMTEDILRVMARGANGTTTVTVASCVDGTITEIDLAKPFHRISVYDEIQRVAQVELPPPAELNTPRGLAYMSAIMLRYDIPLPPVRTAAKMFDKLIDYFVTDRVVRPTFVMDHPIFMSPLAKEHDSDDRRGLSERFELFINGTEYCNAYSELNDPQEQYYRFQQQLADRQTGDEEAMQLDETFLKALQMGLPPTAGWGMGVDRVLMLLNGSSTIRDEIIFPLLRQDVDSHDAKRRRRTASSFGFSYQTTLFCLNALEEEMVKHRAPVDSMEKVRQLRRCILAKSPRGSGGSGSGKDGAAAAATAVGPALSGWRFEAAMAVLRLMCGRAKD